MNIKKINYFTKWFLLIVCIVLTLLATTFCISSITKGLGNCNQAQAITSDNEIEFIYQTKTDLFVGDTQDICIGFNRSANHPDAQLVINKVGTDENIILKPVRCIDEMVFYSYFTTDNSQIGTYVLNYIEWNEDDNSTLCKQYIEENTRVGYSFSVNESVGQYDETQVPASIYSVTENGLEQIEGFNSTTMLYSPNIIRNKYQECIASGNNFLVALDAGHGGSDPGACYGPYSEKDLNLRIAQACEAELNTYNGVSVYMVRADDEYIGLKERADRAINAGANLFVCLHNNSGGGSGCEVWVQHSGGYHSEFNSIGCEIGSRIINKLTSSFGLNDRGLKERYSTDGSTYPDGSAGDYFTVLYWTRYYEIPGILVEHAFMDGSDQDQAALYNDSNLALMGQLDAQAIAEYYGFSKGGPPSDVVYGTFSFQTNVDNNYALSVKDNSYLDEAPIVLGQDNDDKINKWIIHEEGDGWVSLENAATGKYLDVPNSKAVPTAAIQQFKKNDANNQKWKIYRDGMSYKIVSRLNTNLCVDLANSQVSENTPFILFNDCGTSNQRFTLNAFVPPSDAVEDGYYKISTCIDNTKVFDMPGSSVQNEVRPILFTEHENYLNEVFKIQKVGNYHSIVNVVSDKALEVYNSDTHLESVIQQFTFNNTKNQLWSFQKESDGTYVMQNVATCLVVDIHGGKAEDLATLQCFKPHGGQNQEWKLKQVENPYSSINTLAKQYSTLIPDGKYSIFSKAGNNLVIDVENSSKENNGNISLFTDYTTKNQQWSIYHDSDGFVYFRNVNSGKLLNIESGTKAANSNISQYQTSGLSSQKWVVVPNTDGTYMIVSGMINGLNLASASESAVNQTNVITFYKNSTSSQKFSFVKLDVDVPGSDSDFIDGYYTIGSADNPNQRLGITSSSLENGAHAITWKTGDTNNEIFKIVKDGKYHRIKSVVSDKYLDISESTIKPGSFVVQNSSEAANNLLWAINKQNDGTYRFTNTLNGLCIDILGHKAKSGADSIIESKDNRASQKWTLTKTEDPCDLDAIASANINAIKDGQYCIKSIASSDKGVEVRGSSMDNGANIELFTYNRTSNQLWVVTHDEKGYVLFKNLCSGKYMDVEYSSKRHGSNVSQCQVTGNKNQKWIVVPVAGGFVIKSALIKGLNLSLSGTFDSSNVYNDLSDDSNAYQQFSFSQDTPAPTGTTIMGAPTSDAGQMARYYCAIVGAGTYPDYYRNNPQLGATSIEAFAQICYEEGIAEGVNPAVMFGQMIHETGWLRFGGSVKVEQCNFGGLGATSATVGGAWFPDIRTGIRAQIQHLKAYGSTAPLNNACVDPRFNLVSRGCAPLVTDLNGKWAVPGVGYGEAIIAHMNKMRNY